MAIYQALLSTFLLVTLVRAAPNHGLSNTLPDPLADEAINYRLPDKVVPISYDLKLKLPNLEGTDFLFDGEVRIEIDVRGASEKTVTLHAKGLTITEKPVIYKNKNEIMKINALEIPKPNTKNDFLLIDFGESIPKGKHILSIKYQGVINDESEGFYRSNYTTSEGKLVWLAATHFEPVGARRAFPCFDEPHLKATFKISIRHREDFQAISNMHFTGIKEENDQQLWTTFAETPKMSTYLVAFVVSDFAKVINNKNYFHVYARKHKIDHTKYALTMGEKILEELDFYTDIPQISGENKFKRMQFIALPLLQASAMENWGLITYQESSLLVEEGVSTTAEIQSVATVITHELAHQWFGNIVSPSWWKYLWLNEGFANYFQYFITNGITQEGTQWRLMDQFVVDSLQRNAFPADSESNAVAMNHDVENPKDIRDKFNLISYNKAGAVIRMISHILTESKFKGALKSYLQKMKYQAASSSDLFLEFENKFSQTYEITRNDFKHALENWESTPGFPIITVERDYIRNTSTVKQERFLFKKDPAHVEKYWVALNFAQTKRSFANTEPRYWMKPGEEKKHVPIANSEKWAIFNVQQTGYYRVNYDKKNWNLIIDALKSNKTEDIHVLNRAQLIDDALNLARISKLNYTIALELASYLEKEKDYIPWRAAFNGFSFLYKRLTNTDYHEDFKGYLLELVAHVEASLKYDPNPEDDHLTKFHRVEIQKWACMLGSVECNENASAKLDKWLENSSQNPLPVDAKNVILCAGIRNANQTKWDQLFEKYTEVKDSNLLKALGCSSDEKILKNYLEMTKNESAVVNNRDTVISAVYSGSAIGINVVLDFIINEYKSVSTIIGSKNKLEKFAENFGSLLTTQAQIDKLNLFKDKFEEKDILETIDKGIKVAVINVEWVKKYAPEIARYYAKPVPSEPETEPSNSASVSVFSTILLLVTFVASQIN